MGTLNPKNNKWHIYKIKGKQSVNSGYHVTVGLELEGREAAIAFFVYFCILWILVLRKYYCANRKKFLINEPNSKMTFIKGLL